MTGRDESEASGRDGSGSASATSGCEGDVLVRFRGGRVYAWSERDGVFAEAATVGEAIEALGRARERYRAFSEATGLGAFARRLNRPWVLPPHIRKGLWALLLAGLLLFQLSYALSLGIERGIGNSFSAEWRAGMEAAVERALVSLADPKREMAPERKALMLDAIRGFKRRYGFFWDALVGNKTARPRSMRTFTNPDRPPVAGRSTARPRLPATRSVTNPDRPPAARRK